MEFILGLITGLIAGLIIMCCLIAGKEDKELIIENNNLREQIKVMEELSKKYEEVIEMLQRGDKE